MKVFLLPICDYQVQYFDISILSASKDVIKSTVFTGEIQTDFSKKFFPSRVFSESGGKRVKHFGNLYYLVKKANIRIKCYLYFSNVFSFTGA